MFHMGWFVGRGYSVHAWNQPWSGTIGAGYMRPDLYIDLVRAMDGHAIAFGLRPNVDGHVLPRDLRT